MGLRFRRSRSFGPIRLTAGKRGLSVSAGVPGLRVSHSATGRRTLTLSALGTGLSWIFSLGRRRSRPPLHK
jgi:uncharacterized protein DUF4236